MLCLRGSSMGVSGIMIEDILQDLKRPKEIQSLTGDIELAPLPNISLDAADKQKDIFSLDQRKAWDKSVEARCDFSYCLRLTRRASTNFIMGSVRATT